MEDKQYYLSCLFLITIHRNAYWKHDNISCVVPNMLFFSIVLICVLGIDNSAIADIIQDFLINALNTIIYLHRIKVFNH